MKKRNHEIIFISIYIILFFFVQAIYAYFYYHTVLKSDYLLQTVIRFSIWTVPVFLCLIIDKKNPFKYLKLDRNILQGVLWGLAIGILIILYNIVTAYLLYGHVSFMFHVSKSSFFHDILVIVFAAFQPFSVLLMFSEEVLFRGFILQKVKGFSKFWIGNLISAFLFALIHIVGWLIQGQNVEHWGFGIFLFALITGVIFKKTNSLWSCLIIHIFNNFISTSIIV